MKRAVMLIALLACLPPAFALARSRPDQVLVIYNEDWTEDLDGTAPGQDSEELARYYVARRTDPVTGRKPWLLGLSSKNDGPPCLNQVVLKEASDDNRLGLEYTGKGELDADPWPLSSRHGDAAVPFSMLSAGRAPPRFAVAFFHRDEMGTGNPARLTVTAAVPGGKPRLLALVEGRRARVLPAVSLVPRPAGVFVAVDLPALGIERATLRYRMEPADAPPIDLHAAISCPPVTGPPRMFEPVAGGSKAKPPGRSRAFGKALGMGDLAGLVGTGTLYGIRVKPKEMKAIDPSTLTLSFAPRGDASAARVVYDAARSLADPDLTLWRLEDQSFLFSADAATYFPGPVTATLKARTKDGKGAWSRSLVLYDITDFRISLTGPDGIRDDLFYVKNIEEPVRRFLESRKTDDGIPLKDHVLYIVVVRGLPLQVRSLYGIHRGVLNGRAGDQGAGSALTQRIRMLFYDLPRSGWKPEVILRGRATGVRLPTIANPVARCLTGPGANPYLHPLTHRKDERERAWKQGYRAVCRLDPPPFTTALRKREGSFRFLYGAGRIDAPDIETAKAQVDGAIYAERYLTPKLGPAFLGTYQEAPLAAEALKGLGFTVKPLPARADRASIFLGAFGYGAVSAADTATADAKSVVWEKGFYPGSVAYGIRSFLGWDRRRPPRSRGKLFEQVLRGGATITAGSAGGAHDSNLTWPDEFVLLHLLFRGYEYGDAALRAGVYLDWTLSLVGDPLYAPDLSKTKPDTTPPVVKRKEDVRLEVKPAGPGTFAVRAEVTLGNDDPEMAETRITCRAAKGPAKPLTGANPRYQARPDAWAAGLAPDTDYRVEITLADPYGNRFLSKRAFGELRIRTPKARPVTVIHDYEYPKWRPGTDYGKAVLGLTKTPLEAAGEIRIRCLVGPGHRLPEVETAAGFRLLSARELRVGGAAAPLAELKGLPVGREVELILRWRRFPVTREACLAARDGTEHLIAAANRLPWNPAEKIGRWIEVRGPAKVRHITVLDDAPSAPTSHRGLFPPAFDAAAFLRHDR